MKIYISYPRTEHGFVADLAGVLRKRGFEAFYDDDIPVGAVWADVHAEKIAEANESSLSIMIPCTEDKHVGGEIPLLAKEPIANYPCCNRQQFRGTF